ncbi:MAG TPA: NUDIX hydrolase [Patescibacteria group bacterium]|nr:NUDIX hydrolase [Patescibacteria group bacterium]
MGYIPKHAKSVFKGVLFEVFQWDQVVYDGTTRIFEAVQRQYSTYAIATKGDKIILLKQRQPHLRTTFYEFPGGRMDVVGESARQSALRELLEETGMKPKKIRLWKVIRHNFPVVDAIYVFIANDCTKVVDQKLDGGEKIEILELSYPEFLEILDHTRMHKGTLWKDMKFILAEKNGKQKLKNIIFNA